MPDVDTAVTARGYMLYRVGTDWYVVYADQVSRSITDVYVNAAAASEAAAQ